MPPIVRTRAPLRVSFAGGGTDVSPYCDERGGAVLSSTFNKYVHVSLVPTKDGLMGLHSLDYQTSVRYDVADGLLFDGKLDLIKACINRLYPSRSEGFDIYVHTDAPPGSGVGSSSALVVAVVAAFREWLRLPLTEYELAEISFEIERKDLGIGGGRQDQYAAAFGGFNFMEFGRDRALVNPLRMPRSVVSELEERVVLAYVGGPRRSALIIDDQIARYRSGDPEPIAAMDSLKALAFDAKKALLSGELDRFGEVIHAAWESKKGMSTKISNQNIDRLYEDARLAGAIGGKITGAGGGGYMFFVTRFDRRKDVVEALRGSGCQVVDFSFERGGVLSWRISEQGVVR